MSNLSIKVESKLTFTNKDYTILLNIIKQTHNKSQYIIFINYNTYNRKSRNNETDLLYVSYLDDNKNPIYVETYKNSCTSFDDYNKLKLYLKQFYNLKLVKIERYRITLLTGSVSNYPNIKRL